MLNKDEPDYTRVFLAVFLAAIVLVGWQAKVEWPRRQALAKYTAEQAKVRIEEQAKQAKALPGKEAGSEDNPLLTREQRLAISPRVTVSTDKLHGSISLKGARFDDLTLARYHETVDPKSPEVTLFSPGGDAEAYFAQIGWVAEDGTKVPDQNTLWQADKKEIMSNETVHLSWNNGEGATFILSVALDRDYMFSIAQRVENRSGHALSVIPYAYINRTYEEPKIADYGGLHKGPLGVMQGSLEVTYKELRDKGNKTFDDAAGWLGITDKYWLAALVPAETHEKVNFSHYTKDDHERYQVDALGTPVKIDNGGEAEQNVRLFAGAKELKVLDSYAIGDATHPPIPLFDRAIDFGFLYFLTKPLCELLNFLHAYTGNFAIAILLLTVTVKLALYPLASKSFKATAQMRRLQPEMVKLRELHAEDKMALNKGMMELYKREKVNPASGCLPVLPQIFVFLSLYKVLNVSIEMRHAPLFGWVHDLSVADPSNIFTAFGLIDWTPPWGWMHIGLLPILYALTMVVSMKQQPKPADPVQARMMNFMPYFLLVIFAKMPSGLVFYFIWSNLLSILQQFVIGKRHGAPAGKAKAA